MNKKQKIEAIENAYIFTGENPETKGLSKDFKKNIYLLNEKLSNESHDAIFDLQMKFKNNNDIDFDLSYEIMAQACNVIAENPNIKEEDIQEAINNNFSSIYTADRLAYLTINNQQEISDLMKEYEAENISDACAYWYDNQVQSAISLLIEFINKTN